MADTQDDFNIAFESLPKELRKSIHRFCRPRAAEFVSKAEKFAAAAASRTLTFDAIVAAIAAAEPTFSGKPSTTDVVDLCRKVVTDKMQAHNTLEHCLHTTLELLAALLESRPTVHHTFAAESPYGLAEINAAIIKENNGVVSQKGLDAMLASDPSIETRDGQQFQGDVASVVCNYVAYINRFITRAWMGPTPGLPAYNSEHHGPYGWKRSVPPGSLCQKARANAQFGRNPEDSADTLRLKMGFYSETRTNARGFFQFTVPGVTFPDIHSRTVSMGDIVRILLENHQAMHLVAGITDIGSQPGAAATFLQEWAAAAVASSLLFSCPGPTDEEPSPAAVHLHAGFLDVAML